MLIHNAETSLCKLVLEVVQSHGKVGSITDPKIQHRVIELTFPDESCGRCVHLALKLVSACLSSSGRGSPTKWHKFSIQLRQK
eukprot:2038598-Amphidinium_carterae.1